MDLRQDTVSSMGSPREVFPRDLFDFFIQHQTLLWARWGDNLDFDRPVPQLLFFLHVQCSAGVSIFFRI